MLREMRPSFLLGSVSLRAGNGGIARVARLTTRALLDAAANVRLLSLGDHNGDPPGMLAAVSHGCKLRFWLKCQMAGFSRTHFIYDYAGLARAHPVLRRLQHPYAVWLHGLEGWEGMRPEIGAALRRADMVLVNSNYTLARFERLHGPLPLARVCWLATEDDEAPEAPAFPNPPTALILARIWKEEGGKGHAELIDRWPSIAAQVPGAQLLVAGGGSGLEDLKALAAASPVSDHIVFTGFVPESEMDSIWSRVHLLVMPSRQEGFGIVYTEAMRRGLPVIASRQDAGQEVNVDKKTAFNVDLDRPGELAERLVQLLGDRSLCAAMGAVGRQRWEEHFRYSAFRSRVLEHLSAFCGVRLAAADGAQTAMRIR